MVLYAYVRKEYPASTLEQLRMLSDYKCEEVFIEENDISNGHELERLVDCLQEDDQLLVYDLRAFAKGAKDFKQLLEQLTRQNIRLISLQDKLDTEVSQQFYSDALLVLNMEKKYRKYMIRTSLEQAKLAGRVTGRPRVEDDVISKIVFLFEKKGKSMREIAEICQVSLGTVHKYIKKNMGTKGPEVC